MRPIAPLLLGLSLAATTALANSADLKVTLTAPQQVVAGDDVTISATLVNNGPDAATNVDFRAGADLLCSVAERYGSLAPGATKTVSCTGTAGDQTRFLSPYGLATSDTPDPDNTNNYQYAFLEVATNPDLSIAIFNPGRLDPGLPFALDVTYANNALRPATGARFTIDIPLAHGFASVPEGCEVQSQYRVTCFIGDVPGGTFFKTVTLHPIAEDTPLGFIMSIHGAITANEPDPKTENNTAVVETPIFLTYTVTNTNDSGTGSLRAALTDANAGCTSSYPCKVAFRIPAGASAWQTIHPLTPLPAARATTLEIDGSTQTRYIGDTNAAGPEIELDGSVAHGTAITLALPCTSVVRGLNIHGFDAAIYAAETASCKDNPGAVERRIHENYIGTDPTGMHAMPNVRGIVIAQQATATRFAITDNIISGNERTGIFITSGRNTFISNNRIGLTRTDQPLGNGASGIYLATAADLSDNRIAFNHDFGVAIARGTKDVSLISNSIHGNWQLGIDHGLDGFSPDAPGGDGTVPVPVILTAHYDPATDRTVIDGNAGFEPIFSSYVSLYANDAPDPSGYGEGQYTLGVVNVNPGGLFHAAIPGRLPGPWVTANTTRTWFYGFLRDRGANADGFTADIATASSEFSRAVEVH
ncbi:MAG TPA: right-handed parallel beta-helix repeat-containing protein [Thermoanaerobaculia bacterium]|nr:right-handed parallel beta-helix repeat-containing protein [Thermoanaerobaculia bacterium]